MDIEQIVEQWKKEVLNAVCMNGCDHICCSMDYDIKDEKQLRFIFGIKGEIKVPTNQYRVPLFWRHDKSREKGDFRTNFSMGIDYCPQHDGRCKIYNNEMKPAVCSAYPFGIHKKEDIIIYDPICKAMTEDNIDSLSSAIKPVNFRLVANPHREIVLRRLDSASDPVGGEITLVG